MSRAGNDLWGVISGAGADLPPVRAGAGGNLPPFRASSAIVTERAALLTALPELERVRSLSGGP